MDSDFYSDEGVNFSHEDVTELVKWFVPDMIKTGLTYMEVVEFYDSLTWKSMVRKYLKKR